MESDFNVIKNVLLKTEQMPMRADEFVMKHYNFVIGRLKITNINFAEKEKDTTIENIQGVRHRIGPMETDIETPDKEDEIINDLGDEINDKDLHCLVCKSGVIPSGAHKCCICDANVHALDA